MKYGIAIFPSKEIQDFANSYRKRYDPHYILIPPHITLHDAFTIDHDEQLENVVAYLDDTVKQWKPFELNVNRVGTFYPVNHVIYLGVEGNSSLTKLFEALNRDVLSHTRDYAFVPHVTIGQKLSSDELHDVLNRLKMGSFHYSFKVDRIHLLYQTENNAWTVHQTFLLTGEK